MGTFLAKDTGQERALSLGPVLVRLTTTGALREAMPSALAH
jgi:hypothetical protein